MYMMNKHAKRWTILLLVITLLCTIIPYQTQAFTQQVIQIGSSGDDVVELQARLQYIGYYEGKIDGVFGWQTYWSVRNFQHDFGIDIDGYAGSTTQQRLVERTDFNYEYVHGQIDRGEYAQNYGPGEGTEGLAPPGQRDPGNLGKRGAEPEADSAEPPATPAPDQAEDPATPDEAAPEGAAQEEAAPESPEGEPQVGQMEEAVNLPEGFSDNDIRLMANAVYGEARGEPYTGQVAVAAVIINRVEDSRFPNTVSGVIYEPRAFTAVADGQINLEPNETARRAAMDALNGLDPAQGLVFYYNPDTATSAWMFEREEVLRIGKHVFVK